MTADRTDADNFHLRGGYLSPRRYLSYYEQIRLLREMGAYSVLEIGIGNGIFRFIATRMGYYVRSVDIEGSLDPDIVASLIYSLPVRENSFDLTVAFQVLEHLPFSYLSSVLYELARVSNKYVIFSVPNRNWYAKLLFETNYFRILKSISFRRILKVLNPEDSLLEDVEKHYWHIGDKGITERRVVRICNEVGMEIIRCYRSPLNPGHHFFCLRINSEQESMRKCHL